MPRIQPIEATKARPEATKMLDAAKAKLGMVPNLFATLAHSPAALGGYLQLSEALSGGRLTARHREIVSLAVGQANSCQYCLSAHTALGKAAGLSAPEIAQARSGKAADTLDAAVAALARKLTETRGVVTDAELQTARSDGLDDGLIVEIVVNVALNTLTNYINHVAGTDIDFPVVDLKAA